jgi:hypothetical protein
LDEPDWDEIARQKATRQREKERQEREKSKREWKEKKERERENRRQAPRRQPAPAQDTFERHRQELNLIHRALQEKGADVPYFAEFLHRTFKSICRQGFSDEGAISQLKERIIDHVDEPEYLPTLRNLARSHVLRDTVAWAASHLIMDDPAKAKEALRERLEWFTWNKHYRHNRDYHETKSDYVQEQLAKHLPFEDGLERFHVSGEQGFGVVAHALYDKMLKSELAGDNPLEWGEPSLYDYDHPLVSPPEKRARERFEAWVKKLGERYHELDNEVKEAKFEWFEPLAEHLCHITGEDYESLVRHYHSMYKEQGPNDITVLNKRMFNRTELNSIAEATVGNLLERHDLAGIEHLHDIALLEFNRNYGMRKPDGELTDADRDRMLRITKSDLIRKLVEPLSRPQALQELRANFGAHGTELRHTRGEVEEFIERFRPGKKTLDAHRPKP